MKNFLRKNRSVTVIILLFVFGSLFTMSFSGKYNQVLAQNSQLEFLSDVSGSGNTCTRTKVKCPPNTKNLVDEKGNYSVQFVGFSPTKDEILKIFNKFKYLKGAPALDLKDICIPDIISSYYVTYGDSSAFLDLSSIFQSGVPGVNPAAYSCVGPGYSTTGNQLIDYDTSAMGNTYYGCCPSGTVYAPGLNLPVGGGKTFDRFLLKGACCATNGATPGGKNWPIFVDNNKCYATTSGSAVTRDEMSKLEQSFDQLFLSLGDKDSRGIYTAELGQYSVGLSENASKVCLSNGCTKIIKNPSDSYSSWEDPGVGTIYIENSKEQRSWTRGQDGHLPGGEIDECQKCYVEGEGIALVKEGDKTKLAICSGATLSGGGNGNKGYIALTDLVNNSINDTILAYQQQGENVNNSISCLSKGGIWTAIGCVDPTPLGIITGIIRITFGIMGGVALLQLIYAGIMYQSGDEAKIKEAREKLIATITGLALIIFSILILRILGVNILDILPSGSV